MATVEIHVTIARPVSDAFQAVTDFENVESLQEWQPGLQSVGITAGNPLRTGSMLAMNRRFLGSTIFVNADVVELQRNKRLSLKGIHGRFNFTRTIEFSPSGRETKIQDTWEIRTGWLYFWYSPILTSALRSQTQRQWQRLKQILEG